MELDSEWSEMSQPLYHCRDLGGGEYRLTHVDWFNAEDFANDFEAELVMEQDAEPFFYANNFSAATAAGTHQHPDPVDVVKVPRNETATVETVPSRTDDIASKSTKKKKVLLYTLDEAKASDQRTRARIIKAKRSKKYRDNAKRKSKCQRCLDVFEGNSEIVNLLNDLNNQSEEAGYELSKRLKATINRLGNALGFHGDC